MITTLAMVEVEEVAVIRSREDGGGGASGTIKVSQYSTTSKFAQAVQNNLRWFQAAMPDDTDCNNWLTNNQFTIDYILGGSGAPAVGVGVGSFSDASVNAVASAAGTDLASTALLTVNINGAYFNSSAGVGYGVTGVSANTDKAKVLILLHELAHLTGAAGFVDGDSGQALQTRNNKLLQEHCQKTINLAGGK